MNYSHLSKNNFIITLMAVVIAFLASMVYIDDLHLFFTATDTLTMIATGRIQSLQDTINILTGPMMSDTSFVEIAKFYRPVKTLSFSFDYFVWGLNPFGYHLTNIGLHAAASILVFFFMLTLSNGKKLISFISAVIFSTHPVLVEIVPAIARREEILVTIFLLISIIFNMKDTCKKPRTKYYLFLSVFFYIIALLTKEIAVILPPLVFLYVYFASSRNGGNLRQCIYTSLKKTIPYIVATFLYIVWRVYLLNGMGGYQQEFLQDGPITIIKTYFTGLLYPSALINNTFIAPGITLALIFGSLFFILCLTIFNNRNKIFTFLKTSSDLQGIIYLSAWLMLPLIIHLYFKSFDYRHLYTPSVPFSCLLAILTVQSFQAVYNKTAKRESIPTDSLTNSTSAFISIFLFFFALILSASLIMNSPLLRKYNDWKANADASAELLKEVNRIADSSKHKMKIHVHNLPYRISHSGSQKIDVRSASYLNYHSIKSWIDLRYPGNDIEIIGYQDDRILDDPSAIRVQTSMIDEENLKLTLIPLYNNSKHD